ncbi:MAG TPA: nucleotide exchange factor GrpE [Steroidobacteraceae bacterium]|nr:nucleotide exchange factor GrpE [Steroidobacteraceae bacterium]
MDPESGNASRAAQRAGDAALPDAEFAASGEEQPNAAQLDALRRELAVSEENAHAQRELYLRAAAEIDNVRKRAQRDIEQAHRYAIEEFAAELLAVHDSLALGLSSAGNSDAATLLAGQEATLQLLDRAFAKFAIRQLDPMGERFNPNQHEAMLMQETATAEPNTVLQVVQPGYELNGRLLRPARVVVAK